MERAITDLLTLADIVDDFGLHIDGSVTLLYRVIPFGKEMREDELANVAALSANALATLPEGVTLQWYVMGDDVRARSELERAWPPFLPDDESGQLLNDLRKARIRQLVTDPRGLHLRDHYLAITMKPAVHVGFFGSDLLAAARQLGGQVFGSREDGARILRRKAHVYLQFRASADVLASQTESALLNTGLVGFERCRTREFEEFVFRLLNPSAAARSSSPSLRESDRPDDLSLLPRAIRKSRWLRSAAELLIGEDEAPGPGYTRALSPIWQLVVDEMQIQRRYLRVGDWYVGVVSVKALGEWTEPGQMSPLLGELTRFVLCYRLEIPVQAKERAKLAATRRWASGAQLRDLFVKTGRSSNVDAAELEKQANEALELLVRKAADKMLGACLQVVLYGKTPQELEGNIHRTITRLSSMSGLQGVAESFLLERAYLSTVPGAPMLVERRRRIFATNAVHMIPWFDERSEGGTIPFRTRGGTMFWWDQFDTHRVSSPHIVISGASGTGKSLLAQVILTSCEISAAARGRPVPFAVILDKGGSYSRLMALTGASARYVPVSLANLGVDIWRYDEAFESKKDFLSRLESLLLDLMSIDEGDEERHTRLRSVVERALVRMYEGDERSFKALSGALQATGGDELVGSLWSYTEGKRSELFLQKEDFLAQDGIQSVCFDFEPLAQQKDVLATALKIVAFAVQGMAARNSKELRRTLLFVDEGWTLLDKEASASGAAIGGPFLASIARTGRKLGLGLAVMTQLASDFAQSHLGKAVLSNASTLFVGPPGKEPLRSVKEAFDLTDGQVEQLQVLGRGENYREFLLVAEHESSVVQVAIDDFARWVFTTDPADKAALARAIAENPDKSMRDVVEMVSG